MELNYYDTSSNVFLNNKRIFTDFLDEDDGAYRQRIVAMLRKGERRLVVDINHLRAFNAELARSLVRRPMEYIVPFQQALKSFILTLPNVQLPEDPDATFSVGFSGSFGANRVSPRQLCARQLAQLVAVEGIVTRCSVVRPKVSRTVHYCEATDRMSEQVFHDAASLTGFPTGSIYPTKDAEGNLLTTEFGLSEYRDHQVVTIQEMPERAPAGQLPCSIDAVLDDDLVDQCKPGDRVQLVGIYRTLPNSGSATSGVFKTMLIVLHVRQIGKESLAQTQLSREDLKEIRKLSRRGDIFELLANSVSPSIYGHDFIKKALVLQLLGGVEHNLENGTHIRGDINILMVGDPSTAKSQLLRSMLNIAPLSINTTGRGSSGVGLTAAVTTDKETGERRLEAGAMVLGDRGLVCIDEFDKMSEIDRVAIHEVMEQQTVTIAKAGIHMSLNARCSVLAAANPYYGQYDRSRTPVDNVALPDSLLSRFDLLFIVLDNVDPEIDRAISDHVLRNHRFQGKSVKALDDFEEQDDDEADEHQVFQKYDRLLHGRRRGDERVELLTVSFLKKYVEYAKSRFQPVLTEEAADMVSSAYADLRTKESQNDRTLPVTARSLETLIRLSSAHAKLHLHTEVTREDVTIALELMKFALHHEVTDYESESESESDHDDDDDEDGGGDDGSRFNLDLSDDDDEDDDGSSRHGRGRKSKSKSKSKSTPKKATKSRKSRAMDVEDDDDDDDDGDVQMGSSSSSSSRSIKRQRSPSRSPSKGPSKSPRLRKADEGSESPSKKKKASGKSKAKSTAATTAQDLSEFQKCLSRAMAKRRDPSAELTLDEVIVEVNANRDRAWSEGQIEGMLQELEDQNKLMYRKGVIYQL